MPIWPDFIDPADLAPGDVVPHPALPEGLRLVVVEAVDTPAFATAYGILDGYFGPVGELESREVLARRLAWRPEVPVAGHHLLYQMLLICQGNEVVGLRDHTAVVRPDVPEVVVHLSHVFVQPAWRRCGVSALLRTLPVRTARECARCAGFPNLPVTLFCEMEPNQPAVEDNRVRRVSYEAAGYRALGSHLGYLQPDFRPPAAIDADPLGNRPLAFDFLLRRVGREAETVLSSAEVIRAIELIYAMYAASFRPQELEVCQAWLDGFRQNAAPTYPLYRPTKAP